MHVLWHCYLEPGRMSNVQLAKLLGVSDSLISDYCNRVNRQLQTLELTIEQARVFEIALKRRTARILSATGQQVA
jgi:predicted transcriptional regulator